MVEDGRFWMNGWSTLLDTGFMCGTPKKMIFLDFHGFSGQLHPPRGTTQKTAARQFFVFFWLIPKWGTQKFCEKKCLKLAKTLTSWILGQNSAAMNSLYRVFIGRCLMYPIVSMYAIYGNMDPINIPPLC